MGNLLSAVVNDSNSPEDALLLASMNGDLDRVRELLQEEEGCDINTNNNREQKTPLHFACCGGHLPVCQLLLEHGANVNLPDRHGTTPIHWASLVCNLQLAELLLKDHDIDVNPKDDNGMTPLHLLCRRKYARARPQRRMLQLLMDHGADVNAKDNDGMTPLNMACGHGHDLDLFELLMEHGADVSQHPSPPAGKAVEVDTMTPLHRACQIGHLKVVKLLLSRGAKIDASTEHGYTPLELASERNHLKTVWFLVRQHPWLVSESLE